MPNFEELLLFLDNLTNLHRTRCECWDLDVEYVPGESENNVARKSNMAASAILYFEKSQPFRRFLSKYRDYIRTILHAII